jgi:demethylmenaquinone methyltransferase/2-methoxy-6-polyprenyl-1,4-benzoquinol methylase
LDLAGGTGDFSIHVSPIVGKEGQVVLADINEVMLQVGRDRIIDKGLSNNVDFVKLNAEALPFAQNTFDCVCIAYGLRNITDKGAALTSIQRVLKPGGRILILEFSKPQNKLLDRAYRTYSSFWPVIGRLITGDAQSYRYLVESIDMHPDQEMLLSMMTTAGLVDCKYHNVMNGICAVHTGMKPFSNASE